MMVSVCMITYNHEKYIAQAIEGVIMQKTDFDFELVIGEDCSTDNTRKICKKYADAYPEIIKLLPEKRNLGMIPNFNRTLNKCTGHYIAICEGDDYWIDPNKLQKQYDFLKNNPEVKICCTNYQTKANEIITDQKRTDKTKIIAGEEVFYENIVPTLTSVFVNSKKKYMLNKSLPYADWYLWADIINSTKGKISILEYITAIQNIHADGAYSSIEDEHLKFYNAMRLKQRFLFFSKYRNQKLANELFGGFKKIKDNYSFYEKYLSKKNALLNFYMYKIIRKLLSIRLF